MSVTHKTIILALAADHAGFAMKQALLTHAEEKGIAVLDLGTHDESRVDYPDFGAALAAAVTDGRATLGLGICGSGIGISIALNRHRGIRAALCQDVTAARLARLHNDANVLCLGARLIGPSTAIDCLDAFLETPFEGGRHQGRVDKLEKLG